MTSMAQINMGSTSNNSKDSVRNDGRDRLSELPDEILVHILSFLPILDAVRTVLIRRFGNLWTLVSSLNFRDCEFLKTENWRSGAITSVSRFTRFVGNVLLLHKGFPANKFLLVGDDNEQLVSWIRFAIKRQVKELYVRFDYDYYDYVLPSCVFTSRFLVKLKLVRCEIEGLSRVQMGSLRRLSLTHVKVSNELLDKIMSRCPCLQELVMRNVHKLDELRIAAPNIEKLHIYSYDNDISVLDCPNLKILNVHLISSIKGSILQVVNIPSVCEVHIRSTFQIDKIVNKICTVEVVKFSNGAFPHSNFKDLDIPQTMWKRLHIESHLNEDQLKGICRVLRRSPHLEELRVCSYSQWNLWRDLGKSRKTHEDHVLSEELSSPCAIPLLKSVTIHGHKVPCQGLLRLAEFLLKSCVNFEKMVILPSTYKLGAVEELKFLQQLLSFPRASANARVTYGSEIY